MKLRQQPLPLFVILIRIVGFSLHVYAEPVTAVTRSEKEVPLGPSEEPSGVATSTRSISDLNLDSGSEDWPIDGKDGRPHKGPFVETKGDRERKKAKENGDEEAAAAKLPSALDLKKGARYDEENLPKTNDGVMDDPNRAGPKEGTRGTEGGISERVRDRKKEQNDITGLQAEKKPDPPKEAPPLPHSEQQIVSQSSSKDSDKSGSSETPEKEEKPKELGGLEKPTDLPEKPHDIPPPSPPISSKAETLDILNSIAPSIPMLTTTTSSLIQPLHSFFLSLTMILFSEIGDKTFLIAALMAMKHPRFLVFSAAFTALIAMTILSAVLGHAVPTLIPKRLTNFLAAILFLVFGLKMLRDGYSISPAQGVSEEMREVQMELEEKEELARKLGRRRSSITPYMLESGRVNARKPRSESRLPAPPDSPPSSPDSRNPSPSRSASVTGALAGVYNLFSLLLSPAWVQTFVMTFLGEWGDRSQIATIAMAAGQDYWWVTTGAVSGHALCTAAAVIGGRAIAGRVSLRIVTLGGGFAFVAFGIIYFLEAMYIS